MAKAKAKTMATVKTHSSIPLTQREKNTIDCVIAEVYSDMFGVEQYDVIWDEWCGDYHFDKTKEEFIEFSEKVKTDIAKEYPKSKDESEEEIVLEIHIDELRFFIDKYSYQYHTGELQD